MMLGKTFSRATRTATAAAAFAVALTGGLPANNNFTPAAQAQTAAPPQAICVAKADIGQWLTDNEQFVLMAGDSAIWNSNSHAEEKQRNVFTGDADLQIGYHFRQYAGDRFCINGRLSEIKLFDARKNRIDPRVFRGSIAATSRASNIAEVLETSANSGRYPALQAKVRFNGDQRNFMTTVLMNTSTGEGSYWSSDATGKIIESAGGGNITNASYSKVALATLDKSVRTAAPK